MGFHFFKLLSSYVNAAHLECEIRAVEAMFNDLLKTGEFITLVDIAKQLQLPQFIRPCYLRYGLMGREKQLEIQEVKRYPNKIEYAIGLEVLPI